MKAKTALAIYSAIIVSITSMAYLRLIPTKLNSIPYFDSAGHFVLYGFWGWFFARAYPKTVLRLLGLNLFLGTLVATAVAILEESLQSLSSARSCDAYDFMWGFLGIITACVLLNKTASNNRKKIIRK
jgi:hypothetical protein